MTSPIYRSCLHATGLASWRSPCACVCMCERACVRVTVCVCVCVRARRRENVFRLYSNPTSGKLHTRCRAAHLGQPYDPGRALPLASFRLVPAFWAIRAPRRPLERPSHPSLTCPEPSIRRNSARSGGGRGKVGVCTTTVKGREKPRIDLMCVIS